MVSTTAQTILQFQNDAYNYFLGGWRSLPLTQPKVGAPSFARRVAGGTVHHELRDSIGGGGSAVHELQWELTRRRASLNSGPTPFSWKLMKVLYEAEASGLFKPSCARPR